MLEHASSATCQRYLEPSESSCKARSPDHVHWLVVRCLPLRCSRWAAPACKTNPGRAAAPVFPLAAPVLPRWGAAAATRAGPAVRSTLAAAPEPARLLAPMLAAPAGCRPTALPAPQVAGPPPGQSPPPR